MTKAKPAKRSKKSDVINFRITPETKAALDKAAEDHGRTRSAEAEFQLQRALSVMGSGRTFGLMMLIGGTIDSLTRMRTKNPDAWSDDPVLFDQVTRAVAACFELLRPKGELAQAEQLEAENVRRAEFAVAATVREIQTVDPSIPFAKLTPHQRWLALLAEELGPLAEDRMIFGRTAEEARKEHEQFRKVALPELMELTRKEAGGVALNLEERRKLADLRREIARVQEARSRS